MKTQIKAAIIGGIFSIAAGIIGAKLGEQSVMSEINTNMATITGDNNQITFNDINTFVASYLDLKEQNQQLQQVNSQYYELIQEKDRQLSNDNSQIEELNGMLADSPVITYQNRELYISAEKVPIKTEGSVIVIDGREYLSREIVDYLLPDRENLTIKSNGIYIGPVISESANLFDQFVMSGSYNEVGSCTDTYGNQYSNVYTLNRNAKVTFNLNKQYTQLRLSIAIRYGYDDIDGVIAVKADDEIVYSSPFLSYNTEPFSEVSIPINNCKRLTLEFTVGGNGSDQCIISDAILYN